MLRATRTVARLAGLAFLASILAGVASALAAGVARQRLSGGSVPDDDSLDVSAIYDGVEFRSTAAALTGGRVLCWYAGLDVDLRSARIDPAGGSLDVRTIFGGTRILVPTGWRVRLRGISVFGGASDETLGPDDGPVLEVRHRTVFGGLSVANESDEPEENATPIA